MKKYFYILSVLIASYAAIEDTKSVFSNSKPSELSFYQSVFDEHNCSSHNDCDHKHNCEHTSCCSQQSHNIFLVNFTFFHKNIQSKTEQSFIFLDLRSGFHRSLLRPPISKFV